MIANVLSIAGSDPSGGAGLQADLKTFGALGCYGMAAVTALTVQNTLGVTAIHLPPAAFVAAQIDAIFADIRVDAVKIGMLASGDIAAAVADRLVVHEPAIIVLDPVLVATSGDALASADLVEALRRHLLPLATLVTPNLAEAGVLAQIAPPADPPAVRHAAQALYEAGARAVLLKGGHMGGATSDDVLYDGAAHHLFTAPRLATRNSHGTGCTLASAIAAYLAQGLDLVAAVRAGKAFVTAALAAADRLDVGRGAGPLQHFFGTAAPPAVK